MEPATILSVDAETVKSQKNSRFTRSTGYKHWTKDDHYWNKHPIVLFNHKPRVEDLEPAALDSTVVQSLQKCATFPNFEDNTCFCRDNTLQSCPRCKVALPFRPGSKSAAMFTEADVDAWAQRFAAMTQETAEASLKPVTELRGYTRVEPRAPLSLPACMKGPSDAYLSVEPVTYQGYSDYQYRKLLNEAGEGQVHASVSSYAVEEVAGVMRDNKGVVSAAVVWSEGNGAEGGQWIPIEDLNQCPFPK